MRDMRRNYDGRNPYGSRGGYVTNRRPRGRRGDRGMNMDYDMARGGRGSRGGDRADMDMRNDMDMRSDYGRGDMRRGDYNDMARGRRDYAGNDMDYDMRGGYDRNGQDYAMDGHYGRGMQGYQPIEAMGYFNGYYGMPQDRDRGDMRRDYADYDDYGDYGDTLSEEELDRWCKRLKSQLNEQERQMFSKEMILQKAKKLGKQMEGFGEKELEVAALMVYTDYKNSIGANVDLVIKLAFDWLNDEDALKGAEKLAVYYDCIVEGK